MSLRYTYKSPLAAALFISIAATLFHGTLFAEEGLGKIFQDTSGSSYRFPRARVLDGSSSYVWGDWRLDARNNERVVCSNNSSRCPEYCIVSPAFIKESNIQSTPSNLKIDISQKTFVNITGQTSNAFPFKVGIYHTCNVGEGDFYHSYYDLQNKDQLDLYVNGKEGRLWSYVWDFNSRTKGDTPNGKYLDAVWYARVPNGNPIEIKVNQAAGDAFVMSGYRDPGDFFKGSPLWTGNSLIGTADIIASFLSPPSTETYFDNDLRKNYIQQGNCDADNWTGSLSFIGYKYYQSGKPLLERDKFLDNNARRCIDKLNNKYNIVSTPLYLNPPEFSNKPMSKLGKIDFHVATGISGNVKNNCLLPVVQTGRSILTFSGLIGAKHAELVCHQRGGNSVIFDNKSVDTYNNNVFNFEVSLTQPGTYDCYIDATEKFHIVFSDLEQMGALRMYEVLPNGTKRPLTLNWDDDALSKEKYYGTHIMTWMEDSTVFNVHGGGLSPRQKSNILSAPENTDYDDLNCVEGSDVNARCWGEYTYPNNINWGMGNAAVVTTWTYYPVSDRHFFTLTVVDSGNYNKAMTKTCHAPKDPQTNQFIDTNITDDDGDGIPDVIEGKSNIAGIPDRDTDGDGTPDYKTKTDSDGDGIPDDVECHFDGRRKGYGFVDGCEDTDFDGIPDYLDTDSDNDGIPDRAECDYSASASGPFHRDGCLVSNPGKNPTPDYRNPDEKHTDPRDSTTDATRDSDGDGIPDITEGFNSSDPTNSTDTDSDGTPDYLDTDSDNDGIPDKVEAGSDPTNPRDTDGDGTPDYQDTDSDGDDKPDSWECVYDANRTGIQFIDGCLDSTFSGIPDYLNSNQHSGDDPTRDPATHKGKNKGNPGIGNNDEDQDGIPDVIEGYDYEPKDSGGNIHPRDTNSNGTPDYKDLDSDSDGIPDSVEAGPDPSHPVDTDGDGAPDYLDTDSDNDGILDKIEVKADAKHPKNLDLPNPLNGIPFKVVDSDGDGVPDFRDLDSDNDGIPDAVENKPASPLPHDTDTDGVADYRDTDSDGDGKLDREECIYDELNDGTIDGVKYVDGCIVTSSSTAPDYRVKATQGNGGDSDGDGIPDVVEKRAKTKNPDGDNTPNELDIDSDGDGILDKQECHYNPLHVGVGYVDGCEDTDGDGIPDYLDTDSDNDTIPDKVENSLDKVHTTYNVDLDSDGTPDTLDSDKDGVPDFRDIDSDNDKKSDKDECDGFNESDSSRIKGCKVSDPKSNLPDFLNDKAVDNKIPDVPNPSNKPNSGTSNGLVGGTGLISGGCGCTSTDGSLPGSAGLVGLLLGLMFWRRRKED